jgi:hypothetical protein
MKMRTAAIAGAVVLGLVAVIVVAAAMLMMPRGPSFEEVKYLLEPRIVTVPDQRVVVVETKGDPTAVGSEAFGLLFKTYYKLKGVPKGPKQPAPRARWPLSLNTPKEQWIGRYAMPVPESVQTLGNIEASASGMQAQLATWQYGRVAEILHVGPYSEEEPTIRKLLDFIKAQGFTAYGEHEEEYLKGLTVFSKGNPAKYLTIIRYRVKKAE